MLVSWRPFQLLAIGLPLTLCLALALPAGTAFAMEQPDLEELETLLRDLGFDPGRVDGVVDDDTIAAIRRYQDFAVLTGSPEPSKALLNELRGVAAAFSALGGGPAATTPTEPPPRPAAPEPEAAPEPQAAPELEAPAPAGSGEAAPAAPLPPEDGAVAEAKTLVPPPPAPPKLKPLDAAEAEAQDNVAASADEVTEQAVLSDPPVPGNENPQQDAITEEEARIEAELAAHRKALERGEISREDLARQFNLEGRRLLDAADYDLAIVKLSVAIILDPNFAGAYSNRGTAYQRREQTELALRDFDKARELGFGGIRMPNQKTPLR